jgi:protein AATF/BFR2
MLGKRINVNMKPIQSDDPNMLEQLDKNYGKMIPSCEELIQKWHSRTQVNTTILNQKLSKKNVALSALQQPILTQVYKTLENKQFIETRTHQKRDIYRVLGKPAETIEEKLDFQIYDDKDFYQSIIKEFLNNSVDSIDPVETGDMNVGISLTQEYLRKREKLKKSMDSKKKKTNKISKDRKLKYIIHDKLINFMAPQDTEALSTGREDILKILFGCSVQDQKDAQEDENSTKVAQDVNSYKRAKIDEEDDLEIDLI